MSGAAPPTGAGTIRPETRYRRAVGWSRRVLATVVVLVGLFWMSPVAAQDPQEPEPTGVTVLDGVEEAQPESAVVRDDDTSATVRRIRRDLVIIAGVMTVALGVYIWHTSPSRRMRIAKSHADTVLDDSHAD